MPPWHTVIVLTVESDWDTEAEAAQGGADLVKQIEDEALLPSERLVESRVAVRKL